MGVIYQPTLRTTRMSAVNTTIGTTGYLVIGTSALDGTTSNSVGVLAKLPLANPAGSVAGDVLTIDCTPALTAIASASGTAAKAEIWTSATPTPSAAVVPVLGLTVGVGGGFNVNIATTSINSGNTVEVTSATITHNTAG